MDEQARIAEEEAVKLRAEKEAAEKKAREDEAVARKAGDEAAAEKAKEEAEKIANEAIEVEAAQSSVRTDAGLVSAKKIWTFEIENEEKIPREFLTIDTKKINEAIRSGDREIAGLKIFQRTSLATRA